MKRTTAAAAMGSELPPLGPITFGEGTNMIGLYISELHKYMEALRSRSIKGVMSYSMKMGANLLTIGKHGLRGLGDHESGLIALQGDQIDHCGEAAGQHTRRQRCPEAEVVMNEIKDQNGSYLFELLKKS